MITQPEATTIDLETKALIEEHIRHILNVMGFVDAKVVCTNKVTKINSDDIPYLHASVEDDNSGRLLIGAHGTHLNALQHIIRASLRSQLKSTPRIMVDVNGYRATREKTLLNLAEEAARKAGKTGRAITLAPMDASERHIVHSCLSSYQDIKTESLGSEPNRRVVVKPVFV